MKAPLIIVSGPSGSGKSTLIKGVVARWPDKLRLAVSATTRPPRPEDKPGVDYHFLTRAEFEEGLERGKFLEHAIVHGEHYYGTPRAEVDGYREKGIGVFLDIDVQGAAAIREMYKNDHISVFVTVPAPKGFPELEGYRRRLRERRTESEEKIEKRMVTAQEELARKGEFQHQIVNDDRERATAELAKLVREYFPDLQAG